MSALLAPRRPEAFIDRLADLLATGMSHGAAAREMHVTRNVCIGLAYRRRQDGDARFGGNVKTEIVKRVLMPKPSKPPRLRPLPRLVIDRSLSNLPLFDPVAAYLSFAPATERKSIVDVGFNECRFIDGDPRQGALLCAGATPKGCSYCDYHGRLVYSRRAS